MLSFEQIVESMYLFEAKEVFLDIKILTKGDRQTTGLEKGISTATARVSSLLATAKSRDETDFVYLSFALHCVISFQLQPPGESQTTEW